MIKNKKEIKRRWDVGIWRMLVFVTWIILSISIIGFLGLKIYSVYLESVTKACLVNTSCSPEEITDLWICTPSQLNRITYNPNTRKYKLNCWDEVWDNNKNLLGW